MKEKNSISVCGLRKCLKCAECTPTMRRQPKRFCASLGSRKSQYLSGGRRADK